ncbi:MAG: ABC transporter ATP-binding protein [Firmicutes bacterium]|nr:ABC transporter ATP-binding protein [Bacillota bacterium]
MEEKNLLTVKDLHTSFTTPEGIVRSVDGVSFNVRQGETLAIVGESGCGKTVTSLSIIGLLAETAQVRAEELTFDGKDLLSMSKDERRQLRGAGISMIFQEPMTSLNPVYKIEKQIGDVYRCHHPEMSKQEIYDKSVEMLKMVGVPSPEERLKVYPHQLSGGLRQRVMIAIALAADAKLVIADEPTTALDVTIQAQILKLMKKLQEQHNMSIILITHDFGVVSKLAHRVAVMYAGKIVEEGNVSDIFKDPLHPYTELLILSIPGIKVKRGGRLEAIQGAVPNPLKFPEGCRFHPRCPYAQERCRTEEPPEVVIGDRHVRCFLREGQNAE